MTEYVYDQTFSRPVDPAFGFRRVVTRLTIPKFPPKVAIASFAEHVYDRTNKCSTKSVIAVRRGGVSVSNDLGEEWQHIELVGCKDINLDHCFTLNDGTHLLQGKPSKGAGPQLSDSFVAPFFLYSADWKLLGESYPEETHWHGSRSVDEAGGVVMFAHYPANVGKHGIDLGDPELVAKHDIRTPKVYRSMDAGRTWSVVFSRSPKDIRHFHTLIADPFVPGTWWLSSGDQFDECHIWLSPDNGETWAEVSQKNPGVELHPSMAGRSQAVFRHTDMWVGEHEVSWGSDDWLGGASNYGDPNVPVRAGSRMYRATKSYPLVPKLVGFVGNPVRSIIDVGAAFIITTEAKQEILPRPQVFVVSKQAPNLLTELFTIDVVDGSRTGFTFSRASRAACDGTFFTYRGNHDLANSPTRILRWQIDLE